MHTVPLEEQWTNDTTFKGSKQRHLSNIDCLKVCTSCLVCFISTVNGHCKKKKKKPWKMGASNLFWTFDIYGSKVARCVNVCQGCFLTILLFFIESANYYIDPLIFLQAFLWWNFAIVIEILVIEHKPRSQKANGR